MGTFKIHRYIVADVSNPSANKGIYVPMFRDLTQKYSSTDGLAAYVEVSFKINISNISDDAFSGAFPTYFVGPGSIAGPQVDRYGLSVRPEFVRLDKFIKKNVEIRLWLQTSLKKTTDGWKLIYLDTNDGSKAAMLLDNED
ncbi:hypothetical protein [Paenibacillus harenae]|uniref:Uncharacterized protein n=1 Tax=Paenibacillus harenae TaxID=306543 RepID=A0ABT9TUU5_PAEHA|nr:hypothetical protein [Paenibacillus harenae]MDQ0110636.1 hypothetical protein [Paenibacillus harenae]